MLWPPNSKKYRDIFCCLSKAETAVGWLLDRKARGREQEKAGKMPDDLPQKLPPC